MANTAIRTPALPDDRAAEEAWKCHDLRVQGWALRRIGAALGISKDTVDRRLAWAQKQLLLPVVIEYRQIQNERLENLLSLTLENVRKPMMYEGVHCTNLAGEPLYTVDLDKVEKARKIINDLSELHGVKAAVEINHRVIEITEDDLALIQEINDATRARMEERGWETPGADA